MEADLNPAVGVTRVARKRGEWEMTDQRTPDRPWMMRTYSGHSTAKASNELYRTNLAKGQTGLSIAFDLPTQTGYDSDDPMARGEVGKVGVPVSHIGHMETLLDGIPVGDMNTSMTINAVAAWMLGLYVANAEKPGRRVQGAARHHPERHREGVPEPRHLHLPAAALQAPDRRHVRVLPGVDPALEPHERLQLPPAGGRGHAGPGDRLLAGHRHRRARRGQGVSGQVPADRMPNVVASISFFVNAGIRFVEETCKMRAFTQMWDRICLERYGVQDPKARRFRYGVQVNSLGLTEAQPENNVQRIVLEALGVTLSKSARARSLQLPAWNEALGLPRPWDQQWALRIQQVLAFETDLLEYDDIFDGST
jgi:ethylmalonyl-CoA mutase